MLPKIANIEKNFSNSLKNYKLLITLTRMEKKLIQLFMMKKEKNLMMKIQKVNYV
jgi:hypothetical protein